MNKPVLGKGLELVDELIHQLPEPLVRQLQRHGLLSGEDVVEEVAVVVERLEPLLQGWPAGDAGVDVAVVQLFVQDQEYLTPNNKYISTVFTKKAVTLNIKFLHEK